MTILDTIFSAYYTVIPLDIFAALISLVFVIEIAYTFISNWDMV
jgi:hypothetical protein